MRGGSGRQMASGRATGDAELAESVFSGMGLQYAHSLMDVIQRHFTMAVRETVFQDGVYDALVGVPFGVGISFGLVPDA